MRTTSPKAPPLARSPTSGSKTSPAARAASAASGGTAPRMMPFHSTKRRAGSAEPATMAVRMRGRSQPSWKQIVGTTLW